MNIHNKKMPSNEFLGALAHELRNPLASILMTLELIKAEGVNVARTPQLLEAVEERAKAISAVLDDLMAFTSELNPEGVFKLRRNILPVKSIPQSEKKSHSENALKVLIVDDNQTAADSLEQ